MRPILRRSEQDIGGIGDGGTAVIGDSGTAFVEGMVGGIGDGGTTFIDAKSKI